jgi:hypothetical protein
MLRYVAKLQQNSQRAACFRSEMSESLIVYVSLVLCGMVLSWILLYQAIVRRLNVRHPKKYLAMRVAAGVPKNSIDWLFSFLRYLCLGEHRQLGDSTMSGLCVLIKVCTLTILLLFAFLMFSPIFLPGGH